MSRPSPKKNPPTERSVPQSGAPQPKPAPASQLRVQTRRVLSKHYRAKYGVR